MPKYVKHNREVICNYELPQSNAAAALRAISTRSFSWYVTSIYVQFLSDCSNSCQRCFEMSVYPRFNLQTRVNYNFCSITPHVWRFLKLESLRYSKRKCTFYYSFVEEEFVSVARCGIRENLSFVLMPDYM